MKKRAIVWAAVSTKPQANEDEHFSIPKQIADGERFCEQNGLQVVDVLRVPGHSRSYRTLDKLAADARKKNIDAFDRLIEHLERADFDVFICRDANRFARKASLLHYIVESIIEDCGATIYSQNDGIWVDEANMDMWATFKGYTVRSEVKWLVQAAEDGLKKRAERGLTTTRVPFSHVVLRDDKLKATGVAVDETKRRLFDNLWQLVVEEHTPFNGIERVLYERFGHVAADGKPYGDNIMYYFLYHPLTWGVTAYGYNRRGRRTFLGTWMFDESEPVPEGVEIHRGTIRPVYEGDQAEALKGELRRRKEMSGRRRPANTTAFSGLFVCGSCGYTMAVRTNDYGHATRTPYALHCNSSKNKFQFRPACDQDKNVPIAYIRDYIATMLNLMIESGDVSLLVPEANDLKRQLAAVTSEADELEQKLENLIDLQASAHRSTQASYQRRIDDTGARLEILRSHAADIERQQTRQEYALRTAKSALDTIASYGERFWNLPPADINHFLYRLLGNRRFVIENGVITGTQLKPPRQRRKTAS